MGDISRIEFDGINVSLIDSSGNVITTSMAVSGKPGNQNPDFQGQKDTGPIPEGGILSPQIKLIFAIGITLVKMDGQTVGEMQ